MRQRFTFFHDGGDDFDPASLQVTKDSMVIKDLSSALEARTTFGFQELPQELWRVLKQCHELHIRWASPYSYRSVPPFVSRVAPGLHIFFTPHRNPSSDLLCPMLKVLGDVDCESPEISFTGLPLISERFSSSSALQYYQLLPSLTELKTYILQMVCPVSDYTCHERATRLQSADYLDIDYDAISHSLVINVFWEQGPDSGRWNEVFKVSDKNEKVEVGVLANEDPTKPEELKVGGFLTVVGEDEKHSPALFSFPSRHHASSPPVAAEYSVSFVQPTGLHPVLRLSFLSKYREQPPAEACALHAYLTLPSYLFADRYQLSDPLFLQSRGLKGLRTIYGELDLEAPDWVIKKWGSSMLVEIDSENQVRAPSGAKGAWNADIPLHFRYLEPKPGGGATEVPVPWPVVFWACRAEEGSKMSVNPFDRVNLGYDGLFGPRTMFYHLSPRPLNSSGLLVETVSVPVLDSDNARVIEAGTVVAIVLGFLWVCWRLWLAATSKTTAIEVEKSKKRW